MLRSSHAIGWTLALACIAAPASAQTPRAPWDSVGRILGATGTEAGRAVRYAFPRSDLSVRVGDVTVAPALALGSWAGFGTMGRDTVVLGDLVVTASELGPVLRQLADDDITVTAIHNHLAGESPQILYVHYFGRGPAVELAREVRRALERTATPRPVPPTAPRPVTIDTALVFGKLGGRGVADGPIVHLGFDLIPGDITIGGERVPIGTGTAITLQKVSDDRVVGTGDFAVPAAKTDALLDALARHGIAATAFHTHFVGAEPTVYFVHFWADGPLPRVVNGLRAALDAAH